MHQRLTRWQYGLALPALILVMGIAVFDPALLEATLVRVYLLLSIGGACVLQYLRQHRHFHKLGAPQQNPYSGSAQEEYTQHEVLDSAEQKRREQLDNKHKR
ncbi:hypothetical protein [Alkalicoccus chagannorensis]|uniref:hypothetical protein n=1 Tax=Alkalicoccus chagannorensis TaxID=427072 RepID=UPI00041F8874|nr:hypothetical protein [Alkalicoccus chagannorensis]